MNSNEWLEVFCERHDLFKRRGVVIEFYIERENPRNLPKMPVIWDYCDKHFHEYCRWVCEYYNKPLFINCQKVKLDDSESRKALAKALLSPNTKRKEVRRYWCDECEAFHLTKAHNTKTMDYHEEVNL